MLRTAILAKRTDESEPDTDEIRRLTEAAGARVLGSVTQTRPPDPGTELGRGKVEELGALVAETGADTVVVDNELTPQQSVALEAATGVRVVDRHRVVLEIFARQARTRRAQLQVELARLRYRLPRVRARSDEGIMNRWTESGTPLYDLRDRVDGLERKLAETPAVGERHREGRREAGFDLVAIAGYTNAGKSTLLRRLADDLSLDAERHDDLTGTAAVGDRLFETLETTTRRATLDGREVLLTDTVGFLDDLPHWLVESFRGTLRTVETADVVLLVADLARPVAEARRKLETVRENVPDDVPVVTAMNKCDRVSAATRDDRLDALADLAPEPVPISATDGDLSSLVERLSAALPDLTTATLELPLTDPAMSLVSWIHDEAVSAEVTYGAEMATVTLEASPRVVGKSRAEAAALRYGSADGADGTAGRP